MVSRSLFALAAVTALASGCYVDPAQDRAPQPGDTATSTHSEDSTPVGECNFAIGRGCFSGTVTSKKEFFVDGKSFFDADELAARFNELISVDSLGEQLQAGQGGYKLELLTPVDNTSFFSGFEYDLTGDAKRAGKLRNDGNFNVNDLPQGTYDLRVMKSVKFKLTATVTKAATAADQPSTPTTGNTTPTTGNTTPTTGDTTPTTGDTTPTTGNTTPPTTPTTVAVEKLFCGTLYADAVVEVIKGKKTPLLTLNDYRLHVTDNECAAGGNTTTLSLNP